jgi:ribose 5-phosphate isomerase B
MRIALGSDHRGVDAIRRLITHLTASGHQVDLLGECRAESCDYPDSAYLVSKAVADGKADVGILACSNGVGMSIAANKVPGIRAALIYDVINAQRARAHNNANVLCLGGETNTAPELLKIVDTWLGTSFEGGRHARRVDKIMAIEAGKNPVASPIGPR